MFNVLESFLGNFWLGLINFFPLNFAKSNNNLKTFPWEVLYKPPQKAYARRHHLPSHGTFIFIFNFKLIILFVPTWSNCHSNCNSAGDKRHRFGPIIGNTDCRDIGFQKTNIACTCENWLHLTNTTINVKFYMIRCRSWIEQHPSNTFSIPGQKRHPICTKYCQKTSEWGICTADIESKLSIWNLFSFFKIK